MRVCTLDWVNANSSRDICTIFHDQDTDFQDIPRHRYACCKMIYPQLSPAGISVSKCYRIPSFDIILSRAIPSINVGDPGSTAQTRAVDIFWYHLKQFQVFRQESSLIMSERHNRAREEAKI